jgi:hypothetical protein
MKLFLLLCCIKEKKAEKVEKVEKARNLLTKMSAVFEQMHVNNCIISNSPDTLKSFQINNYSNILEYSNATLFPEFFGRTIDPNNRAEVLLGEFITKGVVVACVQGLTYTPVSVKMSNLNNPDDSKKSIIVDCIYMSKRIVKKTDMQYVIGQRQTVIHFDVAYYKNRKHQKHTVFTLGLAKILAENNRYIREKILEKLLEKEEIDDVLLECKNFLEIMHMVDIDETTFADNAIYASAEIMWAHMVLINVFCAIIKSQYVA